MSQARRRRFLIALGATLTIPRAGLAQTRPRRVAWLSLSTAQIGVPNQKIFLERLAELGHPEGRSLVVDSRFADGDHNRMSSLAKELVALKPDLIVTPTTPPTFAALQATRTIPIVFALGDALAMGVVKNLARPDRNATGVSVQNAELQAKQLQLLREVLPAAVRVAVLHNPLNPAELRHVAVLKAQAPGLKLSLEMVEVESEAAFSQAFKSLEIARPDALFVIESGFAFTFRTRIMDFANSRRLPVFAGTAAFTDAGGVMSYTYINSDVFRLMAMQAAKILEGARPADLPVLQASVFEMVINAKAAKALGIKIPPPILLRADRVIE